MLVRGPGATEGEAVGAAERVRKAMESNTMVAPDVELAVTVSVGVAHRTTEMDAPDDLMRMAAGSIGLTPARVYVHMEYHPAPAYLQGDRRPLPDGFSPRPMDGLGGAARLTNLQHPALSGTWGFAPTTGE